MGLRTLLKQRRQRKARRRREREQVQQDQRREAGGLEGFNERVKDYGVP
jgi:hypothetical protein